MKNLLVITPEYPYPARCGFTVRVGDMCRHLARNISLDVLVTRPLADTEALPEREVFQRVFAAREAGPGMNPHPGIARRLVRRLMPPHFDAPCYLPDTTLAQLAEILSGKRYAAGIIHTPLLARCGDVFPAGMARIIDAHDIWHQKYLGFKALGCGRLLAQFRSAARELACYRRADLVLAISRWDHEYLRSHGVKTLYVPVAFSPEPLPARSPSGHDLLIASGSGPFNLDAVRFFIAEVLPFICKEIPDVHLKIAHPATEITRELANHPQVTSLPFLDHPRELYSQVEVVVAPLRFTSGLKIKVIESFAYGRPVMLTPAAAQGIPLVDYPQRHLAAAPEVLAGEVVAALREPAYRQALIAAGLHLVREEYSPGKAYGELTGCLDLNDS